MRLHVIFTAMVACLLTVIATAQTTYTWTGSAADSNFATSANWQGNVAPGGLPTDNLVFPDLPANQQAIQFVTATLNAAASVNNVTFDGSYYGFYLSGTGPLTLYGNITANNVGNIGMPVILAAGNHAFNGTSYVFQSGDVSGNGSITVNSGALAMFGNNSYSGGTVLNDGLLYVYNSNTLGTGPVTLNGGTLTAHSSGGSFSLTQNFVVGSNVTIDASIADGAGLFIGNGDGSDMTPAAGVTTVNLALGYGTNNVYLTSDLLDGSATTTYTFDRLYDFYNTAFHLSGSNSYTGGTLVKSGGAIVFDYASAFPTIGLVAAEADGYVGVETAGVQAALLSKLDPATFAGVIGFGADDTYAGAIDLTNFTANGGTASIGTLDLATLTGPITPSSTSQEYRFQSSGTLFLDGTNPLSGANGLVSRSLTGPNPGILVLRQDVANTYTGETLADGASIIFDTAGSLSPGTTLNLANGGYVSVTNTSGLTLASLIAKVAAGTITNGGVIGFDNSANLGGGDNDDIYSLPVDFSALTSDVYLGTAAGHGTIAFINTISTANGNTGDYFLTGYGYSTLDVSSQLTGNKALHVGVSQGQNGVVWLSNETNTYTGGTVLNAGTLIVADPGSLGSGSITVDPVGGSTLTFEGPSESTLPNNLILNSGELGLYWNNGTLSGNISGSGGLYLNDDLTLTGVNSYAGGTSIYDGAQVIATTHTALGSGSLSLSDGAIVLFTSAAPQIGSLLQGSTYFDSEFGEYSSVLQFATDGAATLTINQVDDGTFEGVIGQGAGVGTLVKNGAGTLQIDGYLGDDNDVHTPYTGGTTINAGRLIAGSATALGTGTITINGGELATATAVTLNNAISFGANGGTLGGNGTFSVPITAGTNVNLAPGASPGTMTFTAGLTLAGGGSLAFEVQSATGVAGTDYDLINISAGLLDITANAGSPFTIQLTSLDGLGVAGDVADFSSATGYTWMIFQGNSVSGINGFDASKFTIDDSAFTNGLDGGVFSLTLGLNAGNPALFLNFSPVPEPSTYALMVSGLFAVLFLRRRA